MKIEGFEGLDDHEQVQISTVVSYGYDVEKFSKVLDSAELNATTDWEMTFVDDLTNRFATFGTSLFLSDKQHERLLKIVGDS